MAPPWIQTSEKNDESSDAPPHSNSNQDRILTAQQVTLMLKSSGTDNKTAKHHDGCLAVILLLNMEIWFGCRSNLAIRYSKASQNESDNAVDGKHDKHAD